MAGETARESSVDLEELSIPRGAVGAIHSQTHAARVDPEGPAIPEGDSSVRSTPKQRFAELPESNASFVRGGDDARIEGRSEPDEGAVGGSTLRIGGMPVVGVAAREESAQSGGEGPSGGGRRRREKGGEESGGGVDLRRLARHAAYVEGVCSSERD